MHNRTYFQFQGFVNTPSIFLDSNFLGLTLFKWNSKNFDITSALTELKEFPGNLVLGKRVEHFFKAMVPTTGDYQVLGNNIQIHNQERTLGEFDFILKDLINSQILHVELMYKFYVYDPEFSLEMERWIGPNRKDSLLHKIQKVKKNQFPLIYTPEAREVLSSLNVESDTIHQQIYFKATLFIPEKLSQQKFHHINEKCISGFWYHLKEVIKFDQSAFQFYAPEKQDWPIDPKHGELWFSYAEILQQIQELHLRKKSPLIWIKKPQGEFQKMIVVWW